MCTTNYEDKLRKVRVSVSTNFEVVSFVVFEILTKSFQTIKVSWLESWTQCLQITKIVSIELSQKNTKKKNIFGANIQNLARFARNFEK